MQFDQRDVVGLQICQVAGERFDWKLLKRLKFEKPLIVAGGLTPENVADAVRELRPYAVDVAGGGENRKGLKDKKKMQDFVLAAHSFR